MAHNDLTERAASPENEETGTMSTTYEAWIMDTDGLVKVDLRDLDADKLRALRQDAGANGDAELVATIDSLLGLMA